MNGTIQPRHTVYFKNLPVVTGFAAVAGKKESEGPLGRFFDYTTEDDSFGQKTWEKAESTMQRTAFDLALKKSGTNPREIERIYAGDLLNQCISSSQSHKNDGIPYIGLYGACSTMAESMSLGAMTVDGGYAQKVCAVTSSHFCTAERQYRMPLEYGGQRTPTAQWTCTASGAVVISSSGEGPVICGGTVGEIVDPGISDPNNMGAAMAPGAYCTLKQLFRETGTKPENYDLIATGDLGFLGAGILRDLFAKEGLDLGPAYADCGELIFSKNQDTHSGGSGCGCSAAVLCGKILPGLKNGALRRVIFAG
ncbi:MAG: stage V sporulation protein AD, partial [Clostridia bacterium]|nr:stage V sporulation protein AD [Clostridia bacterium]